MSVEKSYQLTYLVVVNEETGEFAIDPQYKQKTLKPVSVEKKAPPNWRDVKNRPTLHHVQDIEAYEDWLEEMNKSRN